MTDDAPEEFMAEERAIVRGLAAYAKELFPGLVHDRDADGLPAFTIRRASWPRKVFVDTDQWIKVQVAGRHWELDYDQDGVDLARRILLGVSRGEFRRFRGWWPPPEGVPIEERRAIMRDMEAFTRHLVGERATVEVEETVLPDEALIQMRVTPRTPGSLAVGVIADEEHFILELGSRGWEPEYSLEGIAFVRATIERAVRGDGGRNWRGRPRVLPAY